MGTRSRAAVIGPVLAVVVACVGALAWWQTSRDDGHRSDLCRALAADVPGVESIDWDNGITSSGAWWIQVLSDGPQEADQASRERIAAGVAGDPEGFARVRDAAPDDLRPALDRLHALALDPEASAAAADSDQVEDDVRALRQTSDCGWAP